MNQSLLPLSALLLFGGFTGCKAEKNKEQKRPNILFAISDDVSYAHTSFSGCTFVNTPAFDEVAREGVYFSNCYAGSPGCAPSRSSIVTGRYPWQNEQSGQHASSWMKKYVPFVDELEDNGYAVGRTGKGVDPFRYAKSKADSLFRKENAGGVCYSEIMYTKKDDERFANGIHTDNYFQNFKYFMENVRKDKPFFFWYGGREAHRPYEKDSWKRRSGKKLADVQVPGFLPDNDVIRGDLLDYAVEVEWFDLHLQRMLEYLKKIGELDNTIVIVTGDNGMPFPRSKANCYDFGVHVPLAIRYPKEFKGHRIINSPASFIDFAPTILEMAQVKPTHMMPIRGKSMVPLLKSNDEGSPREARQVAFSGRERHSSSRYKNWGYPQRAIRKGDYLLIRNFKPDRWPAGAPQMYDKKDTTRLLAIYQGGVFADIDASPSKAFLIKNHDADHIAHFFDLACAKRPEYELYNIVKDYACLKNLWDIPGYNTIRDELQKKLNDELIKTKDPRVVGPDYEIFDSYKRYSTIRKFPKPE